MSTFTFKCSDIACPRPTFIGIGGHKCASTWLSECLRDHPEVFVTDPKETGYFTSHKGKGIEWYAQHFVGSGPYRARGEFTSCYIYEKSVPKVAKEILGEIPVVAVVREPVARALSQIKHGVRSGIIAPPRDGSVSLAGLRSMIEDYPIILSRSMYHEGLTEWISEFGRSRTLVLNQSAFRSSPELCLKETFRLLEVDESHVPARAKKEVSRGINPKSRTIENVRLSLYRRARPIRGLIPLIRKSRLSELYRKINSGKELYLSSDAKAWLREQTQDDWKNTRKLCWTPRDPV